MRKDKKIQKEERVLTLLNQEWSNFKEILNTTKKPTPALKELMNLESFNSSKI